VQTAWLLGCLISAVMAESLGLSAKLLDWVEQEYGADGRARVEQLQTLVERQRQAPAEDQLERVNRFFNAVPYDSDWALWGAEDYWATPVEMLGTQGADCEDYAIAKYFTLLELGMPAHKLRITYVKSLALNQAHMVLAYYATPDGEPVILDNLTDEIQAAGKRADLLPVYSFNGENLWLAVTRSQGTRVGGANRIKLWNNLRDKMAEQRGQ
jgi:predicted transglutaminase-like cysteine proteinase